MKKKMIALLMSVLLVLGLCACGSKDDKGSNSSGSTKKEDTRPADAEKEVQEINGNFGLSLQVIDREAATIVSYWVYTDLTETDKIKIQKMHGTVKGIEDSFFQSTSYSDDVVYVELTQERYQEYANYFNANIAKHFPATSTTSVNHIEQDPMYNDYMQLYIEISNRDTGDSENGTVLDCYKTPAWLDGLVKMFEEDLQ
ncbi:MAG: hypothetical protein Q4D54_04365 [Eubacteriales bacterium]|nr:hypothetical protein [Lachnospiraceae bacterium]MDO5126964.1 hypothetical protein [Eubacteriales bacterium]